MSRDPRPPVAITAREAAAYRDASPASTPLSSFVSDAESDAEKAAKKTLAEVDGLIASAKEKVKRYTELASQEGDAPSELAYYRRRLEAAKKELHDAEQAGKEKIKKAADELEKIKSISTLAARARAALISAMPFIQGALQKEHISLRFFPDRASEIDEKKTKASSKALEDPLTKALIYTRMLGHAALSCHREGVDRDVAPQTLEETKNLFCAMRVIAEYAPRFADISDDADFKGALRSIEVGSKKIPGNFGIEISEPMSESMKEVIPRELRAEIQQVLQTPAVARIASTLEPAEPALTTPPISASAGASSTPEAQAPEVPPLVMPSPVPRPPLPSLPEELRAKEIQQVFRTPAVTPAAQTVEPAPVPPVSAPPRPPRREATEAERNAATRAGLAALQGNANTVTGESATKKREPEKPANQFDAEEYTKEETAALKRVEDAKGEIGKLRSSCTALATRSSDLDRELRGLEHTLDGVAAESQALDHEIMVLQTNVTRAGESLNSATRFALRGALGELADAREKLRTVQQASPTKKQALQVKERDLRWQKMGVGDRKKEVDEQFAAERKNLGEAEAKLRKAEEAVSKALNEKKQSKERRQKKLEMLREVDGVVKGYLLRQGLDVHSLASIAYPKEGQLFRDFPSNCYAGFPRKLKEAVVRAAELYRAIHPLIQNRHGEVDKTISTADYERRLDLALITLENERDRSDALFSRVSALVPALEDYEGKLRKESKESRDHLLKSVAAVDRPAYELLLEFKYLALRYLEAKGGRELHMPTLADIEREAGKSNVDAIQNAWKIWTEVESVLSGSGSDKKSPVAALVKIKTICAEEKRRTKAPRSDSRLTKWIEEPKLIDRTEKATFAIRRAEVEEKVQMLVRAKDILFSGGKEVLSGKGTLSPKLNLLKFEVLAIERRFGGSKTLSEVDELDRSVETLLINAAEELRAPAEAAEAAAEAKAAEAAAEAKATEAAARVKAAEAAAEAKATEAAVRAEAVAAEAAAEAKATEAAVRTEAVAAKAAATEKREKAQKLFSTVLKVVDAFAEAVAAETRAKADVHLKKAELDRLKSAKTRANGPVKAAEEELRKAKERETLAERAADVLSKKVGLVCEAYPNAAKEAAAAETTAAGLADKVVHASNNAVLTAEQAALKARAAEAGAERAQRVAAQAQGSAERVQEAAAQAATAAARANEAAAVASEAEIIATVVRVLTLVKLDAKERTKAMDAVTRTYDHPDISPDLRELIEKHVPELKVTETPAVQVSATTLAPTPSLELGRRAADVAASVTPPVIPSAVSVPAHSAVPSEAIILHPALATSDERSRNPQEKERKASTYYQNLHASVTAAYEGESIPDIQPSQEEYTAELKAALEQSHPITKQDLETTIRKTLALFGEDTPDFLADIQESLRNIQKKLLRLPDQSTKYADIFTDLSVIRLNMMDLETYGAESEGAAEKKEEIHEKLRSSQQKLMSEVEEKAAVKIQQAWRRHTAPSATPSRAGDNAGAGAAPKKPMPLGPGLPGLLSGGAAPASPAALTVANAATREGDTRRGRVPKTGASDQAGEEVTAGGPARPGAGGPG